MMNDFTLEAYSRLLSELKLQSYSFLQFRDHKNAGSEGKVVILRHDVDAKPQNSLRFARIQSESGIYGTYYFRVVPESFDEKIIREIYSMGHEIGYHYESMAACEGDIDRAYADFRSNLQRIRDLAPVTTCCMHGSPFSRYDNRLIWEKYSYRELGITGEPYFDLDGSGFFYLTDTGRRWDGERFSIRDKLTKGSSVNPGTGDSCSDTALKSKLKSTDDIIEALRDGRLSDRLLITFHPQRWTSDAIPWLQELIWQNIKNTAKYIIVKTRE